MGFERIPAELQGYAQWLVWRYEDLDAKKPTKVPYSARTGRLASVTDASTWCTFAEACQSAASGQYSGIGFVLTAGDPFAFIDLDDANGDDIAVSHQMDIFNSVNSYAEKSPSGQGLHIILKGEIPCGRRRNFVEIYSSERYMTMTGNVFRDTTINSGFNDYLNALYEQMSVGKNVAAFYLGLEAAKYTNEKVLELASTAANKEKFNDLFYEGNWQKYYPSQSEADFALVDIIAFYSENRAQVQNLFLQSALGQREKSRAQYRINYTLNRCFDRMIPPVDIDGLRNKLEEILAKNKQPVIEEAEEILNETESVFSIPPGLVGEIAQFIYAQANRQAPEIALAGAIGLMAGIVGRAYNISGTGLNQYILLLAPTGTGKEAVASGIDKLMAQVIRTVPAASEFIGPGEVASGQAILKYMSRGANSFVSIMGEVGITMQQMCAINAPSHLVSLRRFMLDAFNKSGEGKILRPSIYSDKDKNTNAVQSPAFSFFGESTAEQFYEGLHDGMITSGFLPRISIFEYYGKRPATNENHLNTKPSFELIDRLSTMCAHALMLNNQHKAISVKEDAEAEKLFKMFDKHCDQNINSSDREVRKHLWNRAHIKALKLAALVAVGNNPYEPLITYDIANWAINLTINDVRNIMKRFDAGEIGVDNEETKQLAKVADIVKEYIVSPWPVVEKYSSPGMSNLHSARIIPYAYVQRRLAAVATFRKDRMGSSGALKRALKTLCERGDLQEVSRATLSKDYNTTSISYMIVNPGAFKL